MTVVTAVTAVTAVAVVNSSQIQGSARLDLKRDCSELKKAGGERDSVRPGQDRRQRKSIIILKVGGNGEVDGQKKGVVCDHG